MPSIKSSTDLRNNYNAISTFCRENREPVFITRNGQGDLAVMSIDLYEDITRRLNSVLGDTEDNLHRLFTDAAPRSSCEQSAGDSREELYSLLAEGRKSVEEGRVRPLDEAMADIRKRLSDGAI